MHPKKYIEKMMATYVRLFGGQPKEYSSPLEPNDNPELDTSELLDLPGIKTFQSMIGACQWIIQLGRFDIAVHIMSMGSFCTAPRVGHLERMKRIYGYLMRFKTGTIRIRTGIPDFSDLKYEQHDWSRSTYAGAKEFFPTISPNRKGNRSGYTLTLMQTYITTRPTVELSQRYYTLSTRPRSIGSRRHRRL